MGLGSSAHTTPPLVPRLSLTGRPHRPARLAGTAAPCHILALARAATPTPRPNPNHGRRTRCYRRRAARRTTSHPRSSTSRARRCTTGASRTCGRSASSSTSCCATGLPSACPNPSRPEARSHEAAQQPYLSPGPSPSPGPGPSPSPSPSLTRLPFEAESTQLLYKKIRQGLPSLPSHVLPAASSLLHGMLEVAPEKRLALAHVPAPC